MPETPEERARRLEEERAYLFPCDHTRRTEIDLGDGEKFWICRCGNRVEEKKLPRCQVCKGEIIDPGCGDTHCTCRAKEESK